MEDDLQDVEVRPKSVLVLCYFHLVHRSSVRPQPAICSTVSQFLWSSLLCCHPQLKCWTGLPNEFMTTTMMKVWWYPPCEWSGLFTEMAGNSHIIGKVIANLSWKHIITYLIGKTVIAHLIWKQYQCQYTVCVCDYAKYDFMTVVMVMTIKITTVIMNHDHQNHDSYHESWPSKSWQLSWIMTIKIMTVIMNHDHQNYYHNHDHQNHPSPLFIHLHCPWCPILNTQLV